MDGFVLFIEEGHIGHQVFDNVHCKIGKIIRLLKINEIDETGRTVRERVDLSVFALVTVNSAETCERVLSINVHSTRTAYTLSA